MRRAIGRTLLVIFTASCFLSFGCSGHFQADGGPALSFHSYDRPVVKNGYVFHCFGQDTLYRVREDGSDKLPLAHGVTTYFVTDTWIYYTTDAEIRMVRIDATEDTQIFAGKTSSCQIADDVLYFYYYPDDEPHDYYCIKTDGTDLRKTSYSRISTIYNGKSYAFAGDTLLVFDIFREGKIIDGYKLDTPVPEGAFRWNGGACYGYDGWIYYNTSLEGENVEDILRKDIRRVRINGEEDQLFVENGYIRTIEDGYIYYQDNNSDTWGRIKTDGTGNQPNFLPADTRAYLGRSQDWLYFSHGHLFEDITYWRMTEDQSTTEQISWM